MANKQIYQLTEALSVSGTDVLAIDTAGTNLTRKVTVNTILSAAQLDTLSDVSIAAVGDGQVLEYISGTGKWENRDPLSQISQLSDVTATSPNNNDFLRFNSATGKWESKPVVLTNAIWGSISGTLSNQTDLQSALNGKLNTTAVLNDISDVNAPTPSNGQALLFNSTSGDWENSTLPTASVSIGDAIGGASNYRVMFTTLGGALAQSSKLFFNGTEFYNNGYSTNINVTMMGHYAGFSNTATANSFYGSSSGYSSTGLELTAVGKSAYQLGSGNQSTVIGVEAGYQSNGLRGHYMGYRAGRGNTGDFCVGLGDYAIYLGNGDRNVAVGSNSQNSSAGDDNSAFGANSLKSSTCSFVTAVGSFAGNTSSGSNCLYLGYNAGKSNTQSNRFVIGQTNLPQFAGAAAAAAALPAAGANGVYLYWDTIDNTIKARP